MELIILMLIKVKTMKGLPIQNTMRCKITTAIVVIILAVKIMKMIVMVEVRISIRI